MVTIILMIAPMGCANFKKHQLDLRLFIHDKSTDSSECIVM